MQTSSHTCWKGEFVLLVMLVMKLSDFAYCFIKTMNTLANSIQAVPLDKLRQVYLKPTEVLKVL
jgi:hypothetical protein